MADDDFYVEDESLDEVRAAIKRGERGETVGKKDLNVQARSIVDRAVARLDPDSRDTPSYVLTVVSGSSVAVESEDESIPGALSVDVTELAFQAG